MSKVITDETAKILGKVAEQSTAGVPWLDGFAE